MKVPVILSLLATGLSVLAQERPEKPNIILILTDDLGWQDVKCYDIDKPSPMETPNLDALARKGVMFWQAYSPAPTCAPSRAAILSGVHPARAQMTHVSGGKPPRPHHLTGWTYISPWYSARMPAETVTIAEALKTNGYVTGHSGKWHIAMKHHGYPQPKDQGFDYSKGSRGVQGGMPDRLTGFATHDATDPYRLDADGFPFDQTTEDAMTFVKESKEQPFFLYFATWLVHGPWHTHSEQLLNKYVKKLGVELTEESRNTWKVEGQNNPFYCAMVEQLDSYVGKMFNYLENTDDPRWQGHKLIENTYIIFSSDNGGMEARPHQNATDNYPLDQGKISIMEGGTRVPLIITGPGIANGVKSDVMINGLDFYPTILSLTDTSKPADTQFDGCDLSSLLQRDPTNADLIRDPDGKVRDTMAWHFPNSSAQESSVRVGDYKLVRNYFDKPELELYRLYETKSGKQQRKDIEETENLAETLPERTASMNQKLTEVLTGMKASYPYYNPNCNRLPKRTKAPSGITHYRKGNTIEFTYQENGARVVRADLIYTLNAGDPYEEWFRAPASLLPEMKVSANLPKGATHYFINLIDSNNFLVGYPVIDEAKRIKMKAHYSALAIPVK